jgi:TUP1-like enhancer of split
MVSYTNDRDVVNSRALLSNVSLCQLLCDASMNQQATITQVSITESGSPIVTLSSDETWTYHFGMQTWMLVTSQLQRISGKLPRALPTLSKIEDALTCSQILNSGSEYQYWLKLYARKLTDESALAKATELCHSLLSYNQVEGMQKIELFKGIMPILAKNRTFQRLLQSCRERMDEMESKIDYL